MNRKTAEKVMAGLKTYFERVYGEGQAPDMALYPAEHEGLSKGSWSIASEGWSDHGKYWTDCLPTLPYPEEDGPTPKYLRFEGVMLEPIAHWCLGLYDVPPPVGA